MSTEVDLKALWHKQEPKDMPNMEELFKKAASIRRIVRLRLIIQSAVLIIVIAILFRVGITYTNKQPATVLGLFLMATAIIIYMMVSNTLLPMLFKSNMEDNSAAYLAQLIRIKRKYEFLDKAMIDIYFGLLIAGIVLFSLQSVSTLTIIWQVIYYTILISALTLAWIYSKAREVRKMIKPLSETIKRLELVNDQLLDNSLQEI